MNGTKHWIPVLEEIRLYHLHQFHQEKSKYGFHLEYEMTNPLIFFFVYFES